MSFEQYFQLEGLPSRKQYVNFLLGLAPKALHRRYMIEPLRVDLAGHRGPSTAMACQLAAAVVGTEAVKLLTGRGRVLAAPRFSQFDAFRGRLTSGRMRPHGAIHAIKRTVGYRMFDKLSESAWPSDDMAVGASDMQRIVDVARFAPSGDNIQPWRLEIGGDDHLIVRVSPDAHDVFDIEGSATLLALGALLEWRPLHMDAPSNGLLSSQLWRVWRSKCGCLQTPQLLRTRWFISFGPGPSTDAGTAPRHCSLNTSRS